jgi:hypothetical protein
LETQVCKTPNKFEEKAMNAKNRVKVLALLLLFALACNQPAHAQKSSSDHEAIIRAAHDYALGVANHDVARLERAFAMDQAQLKLVLEENGTPVIYVIPIRDLMEKVWLQIPQSPDHFVEVMNINVIEGKYATIVINNNNQFFDQLSLYKIEDEWKIVDKLAIRHPDAAAVSVDLVEIFGNQAEHTIGMLPKK